MTYKRRFYLGIVSAVLMIGNYSQSAYAQIEAVPTVFAANMAINDIVNNMSKEIQQILRRLDISVGSASFLLRMNLSLLLQELRYNSEQLIGKTFKDLNESQRQFFENTRRAIYDIQKAGNSISGRADVLVQRVELAIGSIPFVQQEPRVISFYPRVITEIQSAEPIRIAVNGSWLAHRKPMLTLVNTPCKILISLETASAFECKVDNTTNPSYMTGVYFAAEKQDFLGSILSFFGLKKRPIKEYNLLIGTVSDVVGNVSLMVTTQGIEYETKERHQRFDTGARHCVDLSETTVNVSPQSSEWEIDVESIRLGNVSENGAPRKEFRNVTSKGFQFYAAGHNDGSCFGPFKDARGWVNGVIYWKERKPKEVYAAKTLLAERSIKWGESIVVPLPEETTRFKVVFNRFDGNRSEFNGQTSNSFISITRDAEEEGIRISASVLNEAFR